MSEYEVEAGGFEDGGYVDPGTYEYEPAPEPAYEPTYDYSVYEQARQDALEEARLNTEAAIEQSIEPIRAGYEQLMSERELESGYAVEVEALNEFGVDEKDFNAVHDLAEGMLIDGVAGFIADVQGVDPAAARQYVEQNPQVVGELMARLPAEQRAQSARDLLRQAAEIHRWQNGGSLEYYKAGGSVAAAYAKAGAGSLPGVAAGDYSGGRTVSSRFFGPRPDMASS